MSVDITQEEMNILNLNGISQDDVKNNVDFMRATGYSDERIRQEFTNTINQLKPITRQTSNDTKRISEYLKKGAITPFEVAQRKSFEYDGTYDKVDYSKKTNNVNPWFEGSKMLRQNKSATTPDKQEKVVDRYNETANLWKNLPDNPYIKPIETNPLYKPSYANAKANEYEPFDKSKPIGFQEGLANSISSGAVVPFVGGFISKADDRKRREIQQKMLNGETITYDEKEFLDKQLEKEQETNVRGYTLGGQIGESFLPSLLRFGGEMYAGGEILKGLGLLKYGGNLGKGIYNVSRGAGASKNVALTTGKVAKGLTDMTVMGAGNTLLPTTYNDTYENYQTRALDNETEFTDKGTWIFQTSKEKPATTFLKSVGQTFTMFAAEASGELLSMPVKGVTGAASKYIGSPIYKHLMTNPRLVKFVNKTIPELSKRYEQMNNLPIKGKNLDWLKSKVRFDGFLEEMGEEALEDVLNITLGTGDEERTWDNYRKAIFKSPDEWAVISGAVALQGMSLSAASHLISSHMVRNGATGEEIREVMENTSENDKEEIVENLIEKGVLNLSVPRSKQQEDTEKLSEQYYNQIMSAHNENVDEELARSTARLQAELFANLADKIDSTGDAIAKEANISYQNLSDREAQLQYEADNSAALHAGVQENVTPVDIDSKINQLADNFDNLTDDNEINSRIEEISLLEKIKSGELSEEDMDAANNLIEQYEKQGETELAQNLKNGVDNPQPHFQRADLAGSENTSDIADAIKEWKEKGTDSKYFKNWFGNSKVVDENGKPLIVSHGTNADFEKFEIGDIGYHFGNMEQATERMTDFSDGNPHIMSGYLKMENPLDIVSDVGDWLDVDTVKEYLHEYEILSDEEFKKINTLSEITSLLQEKGYDGVIYENQYEGKGKSYIVFNSSQFKSVDNRGTFDANNPNIYYQSNSVHNSEPANLVDLTDVFDKVPTFDEVKKHLYSIIDSGLSFETKTQGYKIDIKQTEVKRNGKKPTNVVNKLTKKGNEKQSQSTIKRNNKYLRAIEQLIQNSELKRNQEKNTDGYENNKKTEKPHVKQYYNFDVPVAIGETIYTVRLQAEEWKGDKTQKGVKTLHLYNIYENKKSPRLASKDRLNNSTRGDANTINQTQNNFNPNVNNHEDRNLVMAHASKSANIDNVIESGSLIAPSFSITARESETLEQGKFGDVLFIRNPKKINYQSDNIYDRDIYSPRMPMPHYDIPDGRVVDYYEYDSLKRSYENKPEQFVEKWGETFDEMFKGAKKVLFLGYTPSGNRRYVPYTNENILREMTKQGLVNKEGMDYGLSSLLARFSNKQTSKQQLKDAAKKGLGSSKDLDQKWEDIKQEYDDLGDKVAEYYYDKYSFYEVQSEAFYYIAKNKMSALKKEFDMKDIPSDLIKEVKDFVEKASTLPRSYFEAKPMREVSLSEFNHALVRKGTLTAEQIKGLNDYGVKVTEYEKGELNKTLENLDKTGSEIYFQSAAMKRSKFADFEDFYNDVISKPKNTKNKEQFNYLTKGGINLRIPHDTILHEQKKHKLSSDEWKDLLDNIDDVSDAALSKKKSRFDGKPVLLKVNTLTDTYGVVLETFEKSNPIIATAFIDSEKNIDNWIKNEAISSGTKTSFLSNRLNSIITDIHPKFKSYSVQAHYQSNDDVNTNIENARGFTYQRKNFDGTEKENLIVLLNKKVDKSTLMHEFAHVYLITLNRLALHNAKAKALLMDVNKWLHYDGSGEYTEFQHERFANHFVAYVATGRAPSYGLKRVFENFRRWLNDLFTELKSADDVWIDPETEDLFDKLLGGISINAQKQEAEQIINRARNNSSMRYTDRVEQLKRKFKPNQLTEYQKRYRDTALSIVHYALSRSPKPEAKKYANYKQLQMILLATSNKNKNIAKQQEKIGDILADIDDVFSANNGFNAEWSEFFSDTGVNYDTQEIGADADLALQAYDVLVNGTYQDAVPEYFSGDFSELSEEEKVRTEYELEYILEEYKNADDKTIPLLAYNEWSKLVHPYIEEDIQKEWERQTNEIDRYEALDKFEQAKEDLKLYAAKLRGYGSYDSQFAEYANAILKRLDFMTEQDKLRLFERIKELRSFRDIERNLDDVMDYAQTLADVSDRRILSEQIDREVRQTIHVWQNGIKKTKYTYPANKLFERLREINKMSSSAVQEMYDAIINEEVTIDYTSDNVHEKDYYQAIEEQFIKYKINGIWYNSTEFLQDLLEKLQTAKYTAKIARDEIDFERRMKQLNLVDECARAVNKRKEEIKNKPEIKKLGKLNSLGFNFNGALRMIFNDKIKEWASFDYLYAKRDAQVGKDRREFLDKAKKIFGYDGKFGDVKLFNRFIDMTQKYYTITQRHSPDIEQGSYRVTQQMPDTGFNATQYTEQIRQDIDFAQEWKPIETELSKMQVLYFYIQAKNPTSYKILTDKDKGQFDKYDFDTMLDSLTTQEKMLGDIMQLAAEKYWNGLNAYHIKKYHTDLGKVTGYFPRLSEQADVKMLDMFNDYVNQSSNGKFQKQRTAGPGTRIASANALAVLFDHIEKANTVIIMGEHMDEVNRVFTNSDLKRLVENTWGEDVTREFYGQLAGNLFTAQTLTKSLQEKWYGSVVGNLIKANLFLKPQIGIKQIISFMNYGKGDDYVSASEWWKKFLKQTLTPAQWKKNVEFMMENDYLRDRFSRGGSMDALKKELDTRFFSKMSLLDEFWGMPIAVGDISAIILGGKPYIDVLMDKGYSKEQAFRIFIETTVNDQQSSIPSTLSNMQRNASQSPLTKMAFAYQNTPWQYYRQCTSAIMNAVQSGKKADIQKAAKMTILYGWLFPAVFNMVSSLSVLSAMGGGDDDDLLSDINPLRTITSVLTQHPILGQWINGILNAADGKAFNSQDLLSKHVGSINKFIRHFKKGEVTLSDLWNSVAAFGDTFTGTPLSSMGNAVSGVYDVIQGDVAKGALKVLGYSDFRAKKVTGEE